MFNNQHVLIWFKNTITHQKNLKHVSKNSFKVIFHASFVTHKKNLTKFGQGTNVKFLSSIFGTVSTVIIIVIILKA